jgi:hypothetical protein
MGTVQASQIVPSTELMFGGLMRDPSRHEAHSTSVRRSRGGVNLISDFGRMVIGR